jgi:phosphoribosylformylglycinamidine cyclo-ligase
MQRIFTYQDAGVSIERGNSLVERIKPLARKTAVPGLLAGIGGFGALFELPQYEQPVLVSSTDGVGTKLRLAIECQQHQQVGVDLVAMCVNDIITSGAKPLFFLDYYATAKLELATATAVIAGIADGCSQAGMALIGGETAEMPGMYANGDYDLAGFCVGIVEKSAIITADKVQPGDILLGLASSGIHANGYSLVRHILTHNNIDLNSDFNGQTLADVLLTPTKIYVNSILNLLQQVPVNAIAHITGGGLVENIPRVLPPGLAATINRANWPKVEIFTWLQQQGNITDAEMYRVFNNGIGLVVCVAAEYKQAAMDILTAAGETVWEIGSIIEHPDQACIINYADQ